MSIGADGAGVIASRPRRPQFVQTFVVFIPVSASVRVLNTLWDWISALWKFDFFFGLCLRVINFDPEQRKTFL